MLILFELSGEHHSIPVAEIRGVMEAEGIKHEEWYHNRIAIYKIDGKAERICNRIAMSHSINEVLAMGGEEELMKKVKDIEMEGTFKIEVENIDKKTDSFLLRKKFGEAISESTGCKVNVKNPNNLIKIFSYKKLYLTKEICKINRKEFGLRQEKPFSLPITMHPRLARALVNIARVKRHDVVIDPFCGTGSILIEACLIGAKVIGIEAKKWIADGCRKNMKFFGVKGEIHNADMRDMALKGNAIVTDFPYGRASHVAGEMKKLYEDAFKKFDEWIEHGYIMAGMPHVKFIDIGKKYFDLLEIHPYRAHKSLTRFFSLYVKN